MRVVINIFESIIFLKPTVGHRANVAEWRHFAVFALSCIGVKPRRFLFPVLQNDRASTVPAAP